MPAALIFSAIDDMLGRMRLDALTDQARMELLVGGLKHPHIDALSDEYGDFTDFATWNPKIFKQENGKIVQISFWFDKMTGTIDLQFLPPSLRWIQIVSPPVDGTVDTSQLPPALVVLELNFTKMTGPVDLTTLPSEVEIVDLTENNFTGSCDLTALPKKLQFLALTRNAFKGSINLERLPETLEEIDLSRNAFCGPLNFDHLPVNLQSLFLDSNAFCGEFRLTHPSRSPSDVSAAANKFDATAVIRKDFKEVALHPGTVKAVVDENGEPHPHASYMLGGEVEQISA